MAIIEANSKQLPATAQQAVEAILGKISDERFSNVSLQHTRNTQASITLTTIPRSLTYTFHPTNEGTFFNHVVMGMSTWIVDQVGSGRRARKPSIEELAHSIIKEVNKTIALDTIVNARLTLKQLAAFIAWALSTNKTPEQALREASRSPAR